jgi:hypothetical protein
VHAFERPTGTPDEGAARLFSSHAVTGPWPADASFRGQPDTRAAGSSRASRPRPQDATSTPSTPRPESNHQADLYSRRLASRVVGSPSSSVVDRARPDHEKRHGGTEAEPPWNRLAQDQDSGRSDESAVGNGTDDPSPDQAVVDASPDGAVVSASPCFETVARVHEQRSLPGSPPAHPDRLPKPCGRRLPELQHVTPWTPIGRSGAAIEPPRAGVRVRRSRARIWTMVGSASVACPRSVWASRRLVT